VPGGERIIAGYGRFERRMLREKLLFLDRICGKKEEGPPSKQGRRAGECPPHLGGDGEAASGGRGAAISWGGREREILVINWESKRKFGLAGPVERGCALVGCEGAICIKKCR